MEKSKIASRFYLDKEKDIVVNLIEEKEDELTYILETPNHNTGNLITNLARICGLKTIKNEKDICQLLTDKGYKECFVELDDTHLKVVIKLEEATSKDANRVIKCIQGKYNNIFDIEVKFVED